MNQLVKILLIEDDEDDAFLIREYLEEIGNYKFEVTWQSDLALARKSMEAGSHDLFLIDYRLGRENGLDLIKHIRDKGMFTPAIVLTGQGDLKVDIDASRLGAADYLVKAELNASVLERSIRYALSHARIIAELNEKEKKYRLLFERSIDPIFLATENLAVVDVNGSFKSLFGYTTGEDAPSLEKMFSSKEDYEYFEETLLEVGQVRDFEVTLVAKTGEKKTCLLNCVFVPDQSSDFCCYQGIIHDLTMRKQAESDMLIAERLSLTGKIARTMAHEVRNPLTNLNLALDQLRDEMSGDNESVKLFTDIIERNANRIEQLVSEMLNSSKPKELRLDLTSVADVLDSTLALANDRIKLNQIALTKSYDGLTANIMADREQIQIALLNMIINGVEAMTPGKGELIVGAKKNDTHVIIEISDNGKGISNGNVRKLFDPFFTDKQSGMGLGLTSTKNILNSHQAKIDVTSEVGRGTTFHIHFKLTD